MKLIKTDSTVDFDLAHYISENGKWEMGVRSMVIFSILESLPESTSKRELQQMLPDWQVRPIDRDPCWEKLQQLAIDLAKSEVVDNAK